MRPALSRSLGLLLTLSTLMLSACGLGRTQPSSYHILNTGLEPVSMITRVTGPRVAVGPITLPSYLDRTPIFVRPVHAPDATEVQIHEFALWGEPLLDGVNRLVCDALSRRLSPTQGLAFPLHATIPSTYRLSVDVARFDGAPGGSVTLEAGWTLADPHGNVYTMGRFVQSAPCGPELHDMIRAQSLLLDQFGENLTTEILATEKRKK